MDNIIPRHASESVLNQIATIDSVQKNFTNCKDINDIFTPHQSKSAYGCNFPEYHGRERENTLVALRGLLSDCRRCWTLISGSYTDLLKYVVWVGEELETRSNTVPDQIEREEENTRLAKNQDVDELTCEFVCAMDDVCSHHQMDHISAPPALRENVEWEVQREKQPKPHTVIKKSHENFTPEFAHNLDASYSFIIKTEAKDESSSTNEGYSNTKDEIYSQGDDLHTEKGIEHGTRGRGDLVKLLSRKDSATPDYVYRNFTWIDGMWDRTEQSQVEEGEKGKEREEKEGEEKEGEEKEGEEKEGEEKEIDENKEFAKAVCLHH
jgi:hypothetical protein